jgi:hypothetical protein
MSASWKSLTVQQRARRASDPKLNLISAGAAHVIDISRSGDRPGRENAPAVKDTDGLPAARVIAAVRRNT